LTNRAKAHRGKGDSDQAVGDYDEAIKLSPKAAGLYNARGEIRLAQQKYDLAIADFNEALKLDPNLDVALLNRGNAHKGKGENYSALADFVRVIYHSIKR
jgi:tetratricopeptide (TPR) repeat protein